MGSGRWDARRAEEGFVCVRRDVHAYMRICACIRICVPARSERDSMDGREAASHHVSPKKSGVTAWKRHPCKSGEVGSGM